VANNPMTRPRRRSFRNYRLPPVGAPKYEVGDIIGHFEITRYEGHSEVNKRNALTMSKAQHWYRCCCTCGHEEYRSQQELVDPRRQQKCERCRSPEHELEEHNAHYPTGSNGD